MNAQSSSSAFQGPPVGCRRRTGKVVTHIRGQLAVDLHLAVQGCRPFSVGQALRVQTHDGLIGQIQGVDAGQELARLRRAGVSDQHNLCGTLEMEIQHPEQLAEPERTALHVVIKQTQGLLGLVQVVLAFGQREETQQGQRRQRVAGRDGAVKGRLGAADQALVVVAGKKEAALLGVPETLEQDLHQGLRRGRGSPAPKSPRTGRAGRR